MLSFKANEEDSDMKEEEQHLVLPEHSASEELAAVEAVPP